MSRKDAAKLAERLLPDPESREAFLATLAQGKAGAPALAWLAPRPETMPFEIAAPAPWQPDFVDRVADPSQRPGRHPLHDAGAYYCLDLSSAFEAAPLLMLGRPIGLAIDVCAAPGGKSVLTWRALSPDRLVANEVIGKRLGALTGNLARCQVRAEVTRLDPAEMAARFAGQADLALVDAPCSGQSLPARGQANPGAFHPVTVSRCALRQRRIVAEAARMLAPGGFLLYTTCTYSREENEGIVAWLRRQRDDLEVCEVASLAAHRSPHADFPAYRLWPHDGFGAGGFCALLRRDAPTIP